MAWRRLTDTESSQEGKEASHDDNPFELCSGFSAVRQKLSGRVHESVRGSHLCGTLASKCDVVFGSFRHRLHFFHGIFLGNFTPSGSRLVVQGTLSFFEPRVYSPPGLGIWGIWEYSKFNFDIHIQSLECDES